MNSEIKIEYINDKTYQGWIPIFEGYNNYNQNIDKFFIWISLKRNILVAKKDLLHHLQK